MADKLLRLNDEQMGFFCPGCKCWHKVRVAGEGHPCWTWNGSMDSPIFTPSINIAGVCHSFVINGTIQFLLDNAHSQSGRTVELPECNGQEGEARGFMDCTRGAGVNSGTGFSVSQSLGG
jgi:hypothetical protein